MIEEFFKAHQYTIAAVAAAGTVGAVVTVAMVGMDRWSGVLRINRGTAGALDRVAQIAERKYCRSEARSFRLGFPRKVPVFPISPPAAL
jgi:hypothetical protein